MIAAHRGSFTLGIALLFLAPLACGPLERRQNETSSSAGSACPAQLRTAAIPGVRPEHLSLQYWLALEGRRHDIDAGLLAGEDVASLNAAVGTRALVGAPLDEEARAELLRSLEERLSVMYQLIREGKYRDARGEPLSSGALTPFRVAGNALLPSPRLHIALGTVPLRCGPRVEGLYRPNVDLAFDRNNCSSVQAQEPVEVIAHWSNGMLLARTRYSMGWIEPDARLSPEVPPALHGAVVADARLQATRDFRCRAQGRGEALVVDAGTLLAAADPATAQRVVFGAERGVYASAALEPGTLQSTARPLTRRSLLEEAFSHIGEPYGWGGYRGARDCSRLLMDIFTTFGVNLPRFSGNQAQAGSFTIDVSAVESESERLLLLDAAARKGMVLLYFPGHIMLYLGRDERGQPMALHSLSEFVAPCATGEGAGKPPGETRYRIDRVTVTNLELGRGSSRGAFIERLTRLVVIGAPPGAELQGVATRRPPAPIAAPPTQCAGGDAKSALILSPQTPHLGQPLRAIATSDSDPGAAAITFFDPEGARHHPPLRRLGGPPYALVAQIEAPAAGPWTVVFGEGSEQRACLRLNVQAQPRQRAAERWVWTPIRAWDVHMENLYAAFIESLFDYPLEDGLTWPNLHSLLDDPERNLLYDHLSANEEARIRLQPDCADLPYLLRSYFAWKLRLPFGFRRCDRGGSGRAPRCEPLQSNLMAVGGGQPVRAFNHFAQWTVRDAVHSGAGRTAPRDENSDFYPLPLTREAIRSGTLYADPYGHLLVVARWLPQTLGQQGVLIAADAQPDGTIGLKRFWRGTFLFEPDVEAAGAGFKAFRPLRYEAGSVSALPNAVLIAHSGHIPYSEEQFQGSREDFYRRMEALINPRPLDPWSGLITLVDALEEAVQFRRVSVDNGVNFSSHRRAPIAMPLGGAIFQTVGPWENYSTPSRDMRLLIALDTVIGFPERVIQQPKRFGLDAATVDVDAEVRALRVLLERELAARTFTYTRSDGRVQRLTLSDVVARSQGLEMAYNPNDCIERRWAAPDGSEEEASCRRHAPVAQRQRMAAYRQWFAERQRPLQ